MGEMFNAIMEKLNALKSGRVLDINMGLWIKKIFL
tara:strand:- start:265 stop:369 length:105 start_codon:yes stop_codon:yes gene_type:complete